jgi:hypothetical protein
MPGFDEFSGHFRYRQILLQKSAVRAQGMEKVTDEVESRRGGVCPYPPRSLQTSEDRPMKNRTIAIILIAAAFGGDSCLPACAQSSIGGVKKQTPLAAPMKPNSIGGPAKPNSIAAVKPAPLKPSPLVSAVKQTSPVAPVNKPASAAVSPSSKCPAPCVARGPR